MFIPKSDIDIMVDVLTELKFNNSQIKRMICKYSQIRKNLKDLREAYNHYSEVMESLGLSEFEIIELAIYRPRLIFRTYSKSKILRPSYIEYLKTLKETVEKEETSIEIDHQKIRDILVDLGMSKHSIDNIFSHNCDVAYLEPKELQNNIKFYIDNGLGKNKLASLATHKYPLLIHGEKDYQDVLKELAKLDINSREFVSMINSSSRFIDTNLEGFLKTLKWFVSKKFPTSILKKSLLKASQILNTSVEKLEEYYVKMDVLGFTEEEKKFIISKNTSSLTTEIEVLLDKKAKLQEYGFTDEEACYIIYSYPDYFSMGLANIEDKLAAMKESDTLENLLEHPKNLIQSAELTRARYQYILSVDRNLLKGSYWRLIYSGEKLFYNRFKCYNEEVVLKYGKKLS